MNELFGFKKLHEDAVIPTRESEQAAGFDLYSLSNARIDPGEIRDVRTGIAIQMPLGYEAQVRGRSGLAFKHSIELFNSPGTVDSDYRGEIRVLLANRGELPFYFDPGTRIAQLVVAPIHWKHIGEIEELTDTQRGQGGFGSTGL